MELKVQRKLRTDESTIGVLFVNDIRQCFTLEDKDRGLAKAQPLRTILAAKVYAKTAIPAGKYEVIVNFSNRFKKQLPLLLQVPGFEGVRIHPGNTAADTEGCILLGSSQGKNWIGESRLAFEAFMQKLKTASEGEKIYITIE
ncbi:DUF5675 family protein [Paradesertivirga mongoliensis]|uniref:DUF5675 family protein n=1 Tax=Paradesertivirga mongoliensis TaxID=2100740 RepID=A0ABW4ZQC6_9SPHI|nr:DUF5675 family protein [Pedobacter mongoliensis]